VQTVKVSSKFQIALPARVRKQLEIRPGDRLLVDVRGDHIMLMREPEDYAAALKGLHAEVWEGVDPQEYIRRERDAWRD
jgi:AbrB family looped-hinge helix DNA binding protein